MRKLLLLVLTVIVASAAVTASARPLRHAEKVHKTHRILAGSKSIRINDAGEVITNNKP